MAQHKTFSVLDPVLCNIYSMNHKGHYRDYELWEDPFQNKEYCEYKLYGWPN